MYFIISPILQTEAQLEVNYLSKSLGEPGFRPNLAQESTFPARMLYSLSRLRKVFVYTSRSSSCVFVCKLTPRPREQADTEEAERADCQAAGVLSGETYLEAVPGDASQWLSASLRGLTHIFRAGLKNTLNTAPTTEPQAEGAFHRQGTGEVLQLHTANSRILWRSRLLDDLLQHDRLKSAGGVAQDI